MAHAHVICPFCHAQMGVPQELIGRQAKCKWCSKVITLQTDADLEDSVFAWLVADEGAPPDAGARSAVKPVAKAATVKKAATAVSPAGGHVRVEPAEDEALAGGAGIFAAGQTGEPLVQLAHIDQMGAFFTFPSQLLYDVQFRSSMPRCCLACGVTHSLNVHLVVWTSKLPDRDRLRLKSGGLRVRILAEELIRLSGADLIGRLPRVPNIPPPYDLPMPYYICNRCSPAGQVMTHVRPGPAGEDICELGIASLKRAAEFFARTSGRPHPDYQRLLGEADQRKKDPWGALPLAVRNRISNWFKPIAGERFLGYVRDYDFAQGEAGQGGLVLTSRRVIFQKFAAHREAPISEQFALVARRGEMSYHLEIRTSDARPMLLHCDPSAADKVREVFKSLGVRYTYKA